MSMSMLENSIAMNRSITLIENGNPVYIIEFESPRWADPFVPINSIGTGTQFFKIIHDFVLKYNGGAEVPSTYSNRVYLQDIKRGKKYSFILNDTAHYAHHRTFSSADYLIAYLGNDPKHWNEFAWKIETYIEPFEGTVYSIHYDETGNGYRNKHDWKRDRHLLFAPYGEEEFRPHHFSSIIVNNIDGIQTR